MKAIQATLRGALLTAALALLTSPARALLVEATVDDVGGVFHYAFTVTNNDPDDYAIVSLVDAPIGDPLIAASLTPPVGFLAIYDSGVGFVDFLEDTQLFASGTVVGVFAFDSVFDPSLHFQDFEALTTQGTLVSGNVVVTSIPEPGGLALIALGLGLLATAWGVVPAGAPRDAGTRWRGAR
jgi:hypothetical protein